MKRNSGRNRRRYASRRELNGWPPYGWMIVSAGAALAGTPKLSAQSVVVPLNPPPSSQQSTTFLQTNGVAGESMLAASAPDPEARNPFRWGPFAAHARISYQYVNISGLRQGTETVFQGPTPVQVPRSLSTIQHVVSPGVSVQLGKQWRMDAGVGLNYYTEPELQDNTSYNISLNGSLPREQWIFGVSAGFSMSDSTLVETAVQTKQQSFNTGLSAVYGSAQRVTWEFSLNQSLAFSEGFNDSLSWSTMNWVNYVVTPRTSVGLGVGGGYTKVDAGEDSLSSTGTDSSNEQVQGRVVWKPLSKLSINLTGGADVRQFQAEDGVKSTVGPTFSISAGYLPVETTSFSLMASRSFGGSLVADETSESTSFSAGFSQRLLKHLTLSGGPTYTMTDYRSASNPNASQPNRSQDFFSVQVRLGTVLFKKVSTSVFYQYSDNSSADKYYAFETRQFGLQIGYYF